MAWAPWAVWSAMPTQSGTTDWVTVDEGTPKYCEEGAARRNTNAEALGVEAKFLAAPNYSATGAK